MAIARGAGTEIIRSVHFEDMVGTGQTNYPIIGIQHHIYTVLSASFYVNAVNTAGTDFIMLRITGYDSLAGTAGEKMAIFKWIIPAAGETFVWNDKFSFNGFGPANFTGPMDDATKQDAIADQGGAAQYLNVYISHASTTIDVNVTYIDQNNA